jgi:hypothetical protein
MLDDLKVSEGEQDPRLVALEGSLYKCKCGHGDDMHEPPWIDDVLEITRNDYTACDVDGCDCTRYVNAKEFAEYQEAMKNG